MAVLASVMLLLGALGDGSGEVLLDDASVEAGVEAGVFAAQPEPVAPAEPAYGIWDRLATCESNNRWNANTGNGYYGGLQFDLPSWRAAGGSGRPDQASRAEQIRVAINWQARAGWKAWPVCSHVIGVR